MYKLPKNEWVALPHCRENKCIPFRWDKSRKLAIFSSIEIEGKRDLKHLHFNKPSVGKSNWCPKKKKKRKKDRRRKTKAWLIRNEGILRSRRAFPAHSLSSGSAPAPPRKGADFFTAPWSLKDLRWLSSMLLLSGTLCMISINPLIVKVTFCFLSSLWDYLLPSLDYSWEHKQWKDVN